MATNQLFKREQQSVVGGPGGLAAIYTPVNGKYSYINVTKDYPWTVSQYAKLNAGRVLLKEYQVLESTIKRQALYYINGLELFASGRATSIFGTTDILAPYKELFPKDKPTGFVYDMPYFSEINFEVNTDPWVSLDVLEQTKEAASQIGSVLPSLVSGPLQTVSDLLQAGLGAQMSLAYPKVGIMDRPKLWQSHDPRTINIVFPLYNTLAPDDWKKNRLLCELLVNQNLYNKRDFITSVPPVFYEVLILGQHYSYAACVTNITIYNKGNIRQINEKASDISFGQGSRQAGVGTFNVPDVYEVNIQLTDMVIPSKNQFQSIQDPTVVSSVANSEFAGAEQDPTSPDQF
jgi:hypothetical protein